METEVFLDTAYAIALASATDRHHQQALAFAEQLETANTRLVTIDRLRFFHHHAGA